MERVFAQQERSPAVSSLVSHHTHVKTGSENSLQGRAGVDSGLVEKSAGAGGDVLRPQTVGNRRRGPSGGKVLKARERVSLDAGEVGVVQLQSKCLQLSVPASQLHVNAR